MRIFRAPPSCSSEPRLHPSNVFPTSGRHRRSPACDDLDESRAAAGQQRCRGPSAAPPDLYPSPVRKPLARARLRELWPPPSIFGLRRARREQGDNSAESTRPVAWDSGKRPWPVEGKLAGGESAGGGVDHSPVQVRLDTTDEWFF
jgi:hypothetical protein